MSYTWHMLSISLLLLFFVTENDQAVGAEDQGQALKRQSRPPWHLWAEFRAWWSWLPCLPPCTQAPLLMCTFAPLSVGNVLKNMPLSSQLAQTYRAVWAMKRLAAAIKTRLRSRIVRLVVFRDRNGPSLLSWSNKTRFSKERLMRKQQNSSMRKQCSSTSNQRDWFFMHDFLIDQRSMRK